MTGKVDAEIVGEIRPRRQAHAEFGYDLRRITADRAEESVRIGPIHRSHDDA